MTAFRNHEKASDKRYSATESCLTLGDARSHAGAVSAPAGLRHRDAWLHSHASEQGTPACLHLES